MPDYRLETGDIVDMSKNNVRTGNDAVGGDKLNILTHTPNSQPQW